MRALVFCTTCRYSDGNRSPDPMAAPEAKCSSRKSRRRFKREGGAMSRSSDRRAYGHVSATAMCFSATISDSLIWPGIFDPFRDGRSDPRLVRPARRERDGHRSLSPLARRHARTVHRAISARTHMSRHCLVLGGARSGKSRYAEALAKSHDGDRIYIATAQAGDEEMRQRIAGHRPGAETVANSRGAAEASAAAERGSQRGTVHPRRLRHSVGEQSNAEGFAGQNRR